MNSNGKKFVFKHPATANLPISSTVPSSSTSKRPILNNSVLNNSIYGVDFTPKKQPKTNLNQNASSSNAEDSKEPTNDGPNFRISGASLNEQMITLIGNVEHVIKWNRILENQNCLYEVIGRVVSLYDGEIPSQKIILCRDQKGPILRVIYYNTTHLYEDVAEITLEMLLRCVGRMQGTNILQAYSIRTATAEETQNLQRNCCISERAIARLCSL